MDDKLENNDWKKVAPLLTGLPVHHPSIPEDYFDDLSIRVANGIFLEKLKDQVPGTDFTVPAHYFSSLQQQINLKVSLIQSDTLSSSSGYEVPEGFFEAQRTAILHKTGSEEIHKTSSKEVQAPRSKVIRLWHSGLLKYASAACFVILSATGIYFYPQNSNEYTISGTDMATDQMLYDIDEQVIIDHIQANNSQGMKPTTPDVTLENYILNNYSQSDLALDL